MGTEKQTKFQLMQSFNYALANLQNQAVDHPEHLGAMVDALRKLVRDPKEVSEHLRESRRFIGPPENLQKWFGIQIAKYDNLDIARECGISKGKFRDMMAKAGRQFVYRDDLAIIGLTTPVLVPYGLRPEFWIEICEIDNYLDKEEKWHNIYKELEKGTIIAIQGQFGEIFHEQGYLNELDRELEQGASFEECAAALCVLGPSILARHWVRIRGWIDSRGEALAYLCFWDDKEDEHCILKEGVGHNPYALATRGKFNGPSKKPKPKKKLALAIETSDVSGNRIKHASCGD